MDQITQLTGKRKSLEEITLKEIKNQVEYFFAIPNEDYINFLKDSLSRSNKTIFDTNIYSAISYDSLYLYINGSFQPLMEKLFEKAQDYQERLLKLLEDKRIISTIGIIDEMIRAPRSWKCSLENDIKKFDKGVRAFLKEKVREYVAIIPLFYNLLYLGNRVINEGQYDMNGNYDFRILLRKLLDATQSDYNLKRPISQNDKNIIYTMVNQSLKEPTSIVTRDFDLFILTKRLIGDQGSLSRRLEKHNLTLNIQQHLKNLNTYVLQSSVI